ncbi:uncharacterized protein LOC130591819 [Beta vulgaris subsp. vulgaris]|uniref:uncharacterized protein LOC130591819 n=1 Tax=Beta vulgaris subsp. vulgaris TaxID=3555 RepID=UPI00254735F6|nr:uncharacterized protein LOC130591819 [Beta vulgaris subsp. vulgaris]
MAVKVLFDSGASCSFMTRTLGECLGLVSPEYIYVSFALPSGEELHCSKLYRKVPLLIAGIEFPSDLIEYEMKDLDVILGMDWLGKYKGHINCEAQKKGYTLFMCSVQEIMEEVEPSKVPVVSEFPDVFPDEIPGMPPVRDLDFTIDLVPGTRPISKAPYRMAPAEMKELKVQLDELLEKGYIRPSSSPWGAPYCL